MILSTLGLIYGYSVHPVRLSIFNTKAYGFYDTCPFGISAFKTATVRSGGWINVRDYSSITGYILCKINHMLIGSMFKIIYRKFISILT